MTYNAKIVFVVTQPEYTNTVGGAISMFNIFCNMLVENNFKVFAIVSSQNKNRPSQLNKKIELINLRYKYKAMDFSQAINREIQENTPDLIIFFFAYLLAIANIDNKFNNIPKIVMFHSRPDFYFENDRVLLKNFESSYKNTTSQILFDSYRKMMPDFIKKSNLVTIPNLTKCSSKNKLSKTKKRIIYLSRIDSYKGLEFLIRAFKIVSEKYPEWKLDIYGQSQPKYYADYLRKLTKKNRVDKVVKFKGVTYNPIETFSHYDFCVFPSMFEGFPVGLIEAQGVGLPVIGLKKCTGVNELILDNYNGFLTDFKAKAFALKIEELIVDEEKRLHFSENSYKTAGQYSYNNYENKWINLINAIIYKHPINSVLTEAKLKPCFSLKTIRKFKLGYAKKALIRSTLNKNFLKKMFWYFTYLALKICAPDGSKRQNLLIYLRHKK